MRRSGRFSRRWIMRSSVRASAIRRFGRAGSSSTRFVGSSSDPARWAGVVEELLDNPERRRRMGEIAAQRTAKASLRRTFEAFWDAHLAACEEASAEPAAAIPRLNQQVML